MDDRPGIPDSQRGLYNKYHVQRLDGKPVTEAFVLQDTDRYAPVALNAYALACADEYPQLAHDLHVKAVEWELHSIKDDA